MIYLKVPFAKGEVTDARYKDWIAVEHLSFGASRTIGMEPGSKSNYANAQPRYTHINFAILVNEASPGLLTQIDSGTTGHTYIFAILEMGENNQDREYMRITLDKAHVSDFSYSATANSTAMVNVSVSYEKMKYQFIPRAESGSEESRLTAAIDLVRSRA